MSLTEQLPSTKQIAERINACRDELAVLKKLYRVAQAAQEAEEARQRRLDKGRPAHA